MADLIDFSITPLASANVNVPRATIEARVVDSSDQNIVIADLTGANALIFPAVITTLTPEQRRQLIQLVAHWLVRVKAGITDPVTGT
jgi:type IV secretory pathway TrbD component